MAQAVAARSDCLRSKVGAVVLDEQHRVVSVGYNGYPAGSAGCGSAGGCPRGRLTREQLAPGAPYTGVGVASPCRAVHAEANALLYSDPLRRHTLVVTRAPCDGCQVLLAGSGLARVVWPEGEIDYSTR